MRPFILILLCGGCEGVLPGIDWQQMNEQPKLLPYQASSFFPDGRAMQAPPVGAVAHDEIVDQPGFTSGIEGKTYVQRVPLPITKGLLIAGRGHFETYCAVCHGVDGSGHSEVARNMELRPPPSLVAAPVTGFPPGRIFQAASEGYGLMPAYKAELDPAERWAVVAYVEALGISRSARAADLPPAIRAEAARALGERP